MQTFKKFKTIAITGLPGSGKTLVSKIFVDLLGGSQKTKIISSDEIISEIYRDSNLTKKLFLDFGWFNKVFEENLINKQKLISEIIKNPLILKNLEQKLHPIVLQKIQEEIKDNKEKYDYLIFEIPLLFETKIQNLFDLNILIKAPEYKRFSRKKNKIHEDLHKIFLNSHFDEEKKAEFADFEIINDSDSEEELREKIEILIEKKFIPDQIS